MSKTTSSTNHNVSNFSIQSFNFQYFPKSIKKIFILLNNEIIKSININCFLPLRELRLKLDLQKNYCFYFEEKDIIYEAELNINIKDIIINDNIIQLKEKELNINIIIENTDNIYSIKILSTETLSNLREKLKIKTKYKFLRPNNNLILLFQENSYKIKDIIMDESDIHLKVDFTIKDHFSEKEINSIQDYYFLKLNNKIYKLILNHDDWLYEVRDHINFSEMGNYCFLNIKGEKISKNEEDKITLREIRFEKDDKIYVNLLNINEPMKSCKYVTIKNNLKIYKYPKINLDSSQIKKCKNLIVIGETGSGKTTLINCFINYLMGINKYDDFRYILVDENNNKFKNISSQTLNINSYYILPLNKDLPPIKVIDTPGFGDTRENLDERVINEFKNLLEKENNIDLICFIMDSTLNRNTNFHQYIMSTILGFFGKDIISNFVILFTFCDGGIPLFLNSFKSKENIFNRIINKISEPSYISFNNSSIFSGETQYKNLYWDICYDGFSKLISKLINMEKNELYLTRKVIKLRNDILSKSETLNKFIDNCQEIQDSLDEYFRKFNEGYIEMENNKDYISKFKKEKNEKKDTECGMHNINCLTCNKTCHKLCEEIKEGDILTCKIMKDSFCQICKCSYEKHSDLPYYFTREIEEKEKINYKKYKILDKAQIKVAKIENIIELKKKELKKNIDFANDCVTKIQKDFENLNKISLLSNIYGIQENFIDYKIMLENLSKDIGYLEKIDIYQKYKKTFSRLNNIYIKNNIFKDLEEFNKDFNDNRSIALEKIKYILIDNYL